MKSTARLVAASIILLTFVGCGEGDNFNFQQLMGTLLPGSVEVSWIIANTTCSNAGIDEVELQLYLDEVRTYTHITACGDGRATISEVPPETYNVRLVGLSADDAAIYRAEYSGLLVNGDGGITSPPAPLVLELIGGTLELRWSFPAEFSSCAFAGVEQMEITINQLATGDSVLTAMYPCDLLTDHPAINSQGFIEITKLPTNLDLEIFIFGVDTVSERILFGETVTDVPKVGSKQVVIPLEPCNGSCI